MLAPRKFSAFRIIRAALILALTTGILSASVARTNTSKSEDQLTALAAADTSLIPQLTVSTSVAVEGWVKDRAGISVPGAVVNLGGQQVSTNATGYFSFTEAQLAPASTSVKDTPSLVDVTVAAEGYAAWSISRARYYRGDTLRLYPRLNASSSPATHLMAAVARTERAGPTASFAPAYIKSGRSSFVVGRPSSVNTSALAAAPTLPTQIRVYRTATDQVEVVPFKEYVKHVLPNEWISSWHRESLRAGAMAVKEYAWYWVALGGKQVALGADVKDSTEDQVYDPNVSYASTDAAVDATWQYSITRNGALLQANYCAGTYQADPTNDCPWGSIYMTQWGSAYHADQGRSWGWIVQFYYPNAVISPTPPGGDSGPLPADPPSAPAPTRPPAPVANTTYTVGQGAAQPSLYQEAYDRNGGVSALGKPTGAVKWWLPYVSENNVMVQSFSGPSGGSAAWLVFDTLKSNVSGIWRAYLLSGEIGNAYSTHTPVGPEWVGAPTSDPYVATSGFISQGFALGALAFNGQSLQFTPWPQQVSGWEARYFVGKPPSTVQAGPVYDLPGQPANVLDMPSPAMNWTADSGVTQSLGAGTADWSAQFTRLVQTAPGTYDFVVSADSGVRLWIDGLLAVNAWNATGSHTEKYNADLDGSQHRIRIQYYSPNGAANLDFSMTERGKASKAASTPAPVASTASLRVKLQWLGRSATSGDSWVQPVSLSLTVPGNPAVVGTYVGKTDRNGVAIFGNLPSGVYDIHVKGDHSLQSARASITLAANRIAEADMKAQIEGDVDGDNCVTVDDFSLVQAMVGSDRNTPGFNAEADLNGDGQVTVADVSLLRSGFDICGDISADAEYSALSSDGSPTRAQTLAPWLNPEGLRKDLSLGLVAGSSSVRAGQIVEVAVIANTNGQAIDGASFLLSYDASKLTPVDAAGNPTMESEPGLALPSVLTNWVDKKSGMVGYAAGMLQGTTPSGQVMLTTLKFRALKAGPAEFSFAPNTHGYMQLTNGGVNLLATANGVTLNIVP